MNENSIVRPTLLMGRQPGDDRVEAGIMTSIGHLSNHIREAQAIKELVKYVSLHIPPLFVLLIGIRLKNEHPDRFSNPALYGRVVNLLESYRFRQHVRRFVLDLFDKQILGKLVRATGQVMRDEWKQRVEGNRVVSPGTDETSGAGDEDTSEGGTEQLQDQHEESDEHEQQQQEQQQTDEQEDVHVAPLVAVEEDGTEEEVLGENRTMMDAGKGNGPSEEGCEVDEQMVGLAS